MVWSQTSRSPKHFPYSKSESSFGCFSRKTLAIKFWTYWSLSWISIHLGVTGEGDGKVGSAGVPHVRWGHVLCPLIPTFSWFSESYDCINFGSMLCAFILTFQASWRCNVWLFLLFEPRVHKSVYVNKKLIGILFEVWLMNSYGLTIRRQKSFFL